MLTQAKSIFNLFASLVTFLQTNDELLRAEQNLLT